MSNWDPRMDELDRLLAEDAKPVTRTRALEMAREWMQVNGLLGDPGALADLIERHAGERLGEAAKVCARWVESNRAWLVGAGRGYDAEEIEKVRSETETLVVVINEIRALATGEGR